MVNIFCFGYGQVAGNFINELSKKNKINLSYTSRSPKNINNTHNIFKLNENTRGAAETIHISLNKIQIKDQEILCLDGDNFYTCDIINIWSGQNCVFSFKDK